MAGGVALILLSADGVLVRSGWFSVFTLYNVLAFTGVGLLWLRLRPSSRVGTFLLVIAALTGLQSLQGSSSSVAFSLGVLVDPVLTIVWIYLLLTFPTIKLDRASATVLALLVATVAIAFIPWFFFSANVAGGTPLARCTAACPTNAFLITDWPRASTGFSGFEARPVGDVAAADHERYRKAVETMESVYRDPRGGVALTEGGKPGEIDFYPRSAGADDLIDAFAIAGPAGYCAARLREIAALGIERIYIGTRAVGVDLDERNAERIGREVLVEARQ